MLCGKCRADAEGKILNFQGVLGVNNSVFSTLTVVLVNGNISIATSKIAVTLDNCGIKWYNMSQGDEQNGLNAAQ